MSTILPARENPHGQAANRTGRSPDFRGLDVDRLFVDGLFIDGLFVDGRPVHGPPPEAPLLGPPAVAAGCSRRAVTVRHSEGSGNDSIRPCRRCGIRRPCLWRRSVAVRVVRRVMRHTIGEYVRTFFTAALTGSSELTV